METSPYQDLQHGESRLVVLLPGVDAAPIQCRLQRFAIDAPPEYEALSYTWGKPFHEQEDMDTRIARSVQERATKKLRSKYRDQILRASASNPTLKGHIIVENDKIPLRPNLEQALRRLRLADDIRTLWIDAICINQSDDSERGYQVSQMGRIFESAASVTVWLGEASKNSDEALQFVRDIWQAEMSREGSQDDTTSDWQYFKATFAQHGHFPSERVTQLHALSYLMNREWFYRRWVVQEVAFAKTIVVQCGESTVLWPEFARVIAFLHDHHRKIVYILRTFHLNEGEDWTKEYTLVSGRPTHTLPDIRAHAASQFLFITSRLLRKDSTNGTVSRLVDISTLVTNLWALKVSVPHDAVFALFSLSRDAADSKDLYPEYSKSPLQVFVDFVRHTIGSTNSLDIILQSWAPAGEVLPSWISVKTAINRVGALFQANSIRQLENEGRRPRSFYAASGQSHPSWKIDCKRSTYILTAKGFMIGSVETDLEAASQSHVPLRWNRYAHSDQYWSLFVGERTSKGDRPPPSYKAICSAVFQKYYTLHDPFDLDTKPIRIDTVDINELIDAYSGGDRHEVFPKTYLARFPQTEDTVAFLERLRVCTWDQRLFRTSSGHLGLSPSATEVGDIICILMGCSLPVVLRPRGAYFEVIGAAYLHGMSNGEAMDLLCGDDCRDFRLV